MAPQSFPPVLSAPPHCAVSECQCADGRVLALRVGARPRPCALADAQRDLLAPGGLLADGLVCVLNSVEHKPCPTTFWHLGFLLDFSYWWDLQVLIGPRLQPCSGVWGNPETRPWLRPRHTHNHRAESSVPLHYTALRHLGCVREAGLLRGECPPPTVVHESFVNLTLLLHLLKNYYRKSLRKVKSFL